MKLKTTKPTVDNTIKPFIKAVLFLAALVLLAGVGESWGVLGVFILLIIGYGLFKPKKTITLPKTVIAPDQKQ